MNDLLQKKLDELFVELNNSKEIKQLAFFKEEIKKDNELKVLLEEYHNSANYYDPKIIDIKRQIINNPIIKEYRSLEDELYYSVLEVNKKLETLFDKKRCHDANH